MKIFISIFKKSKHSSILLLKTILAYPILKIELFTFNNGFLEVRIIIHC